jgi:hypothetical protein
MEEASSSEMLVTIYQSSRYHIPENMNLHQHCCGHLTTTHTHFVAYFIVNVPLLIPPPPPPPPPIHIQFMMPFLHRRTCVLKQ